jgi:PleD family two-component response regulator
VGLGAQLKDNRCDDNLQEKIREFNMAQKRKYTISLSSGLAFYDPENPCSIDELLNQADMLMYEEKRRLQKG